MINLPIELYREWLQNPPDYHTSKKSAERLAHLKGEIVLIKRGIEKEEERVIAESDAPRSNATRIDKASATAVMRDTLAQYEAEVARLEVMLNFEKTHKTYAQIASYLLNHAHTV